MIATIVRVNLARGRAIAQTTDGEYVLIELFTGEPDLHDNKGVFDEYPLGDLVIKNRLRGK